jgi:hypothetical protein
MNAIFYRLEERHHVLDWLDITFDLVSEPWKRAVATAQFIFALKGAGHSVISPVVEEHQRIREWCKPIRLICGPWN